MKSYDRNKTANDGRYEFLKRDDKGTTAGGKILSGADMSRSGL